MLAYGRVTLLLRSLFLVPFNPSSSSSKQSAGSSPHRSDKSVRSRIPSLYDGSQTDSETQTATVKVPSNKTATSPTAAAPTTDGKTLPRPSRNMPPSPFSSLKRSSKSFKTRRTTTTGQRAQSLSPVLPDVDLSSAFLRHQRTHAVALDGPLAQQLTQSTDSAQPVGRFLFCAQAGQHPTDQHRSPASVLHTSRFPPHRNFAVAS